MGRRHLRTFNRIALSCLDFNRIFRYGCSRLSRFRGGCRLRFSCSRGLWCSIRFFLNGLSAIHRLRVCAIVAFQLITFFEHFFSDGCLQSCLIISDR